MTEERKRSRAERRRRHPVWSTRLVGGLTIAQFSHWSDEEPPAEFVERLNRRSRDYQRSLALRVGRERDAGKESSVTAYRCSQCGHEWLGTLYNSTGPKWCGKCKSPDCEEVGIEATQSLIATLASSPGEKSHGSAR